jgi:hypothetical protein
LAALTNHSISAANGVTMIDSAAQPKAGVYMGERMGHPQCNIRRLVASQH